MVEKGEKLEKALQEVPEGGKFSTNIDMQQIINGQIHVRQEQRSHDYSEEQNDEQEDGGEYDAYEFLFPAPEVDWTCFDFVGRQ